MPATTSSDTTGHRHTESISNKRNTSGVWTSHDDEQLKRARRQGLNWTNIADTYFPTKTANACRKRHERLMEKINANGTWNSLKFEEVAKVYLEGYKNLASMGRAASRKDRSPQNGEAEYDTNHNDRLMVDTHSHSEAEAIVEEQHPFSAGSYSSNPSRRTTLSNMSSASFTSPLTRPTPTLPNISQGFPTSLPGISSIVGPSGLPVTTH
ncbi:MAG: hypothetical protein Q9177_001420 [Variospora cf. flavescens]